jgi:RHS repeat-associated protein
MTVVVGARNLFKVDAGVVHALLQARYYDGSKGQFLSEDPVFWGNQNILNPQSLNSYSYANDNPINRSDPSGLATVGGTRDAILSQLKTQLLGAAAALAGMATASGRAQFAGNVASGASMVRSNPMGVASGIASGIAQGVAQNYRDLYYGDDATQDKALASQILFFGALPLSEMAAAKVSSAAGVASKVHGNSLGYDGVSYGYTLRDRGNPAAIGKFGETINPDTRYSQSWLASNNLTLQVEMSGTKAETHAWQNQQILNFKDMYNATPLFNKTNW